jgi:hypothetical protein
MYGHKKKNFTAMRKKSRDKVEVYFNYNSSADAFKNIRFTCVFDVRKLLRELCRRCSGKFT